MTKSTPFFSDMVVLNTSSITISGSEGERGFFWKPPTKNLLQPPKRRNHSAAVVGKEMLIYGGVDEDYKTMDSMFILNLENFTWQEGQTLDMLDERVSKKGFKHNPIHSVNDDNSRGPAINLSELSFEVPG